MRAAVRAWLRNELDSGYNTDERLVTMIQSALRVNFGFPPGRVETGALVGRIEESGDKFVVRVLDLFLSEYSPVPWDGSTPEPVADIEWHFDQNMSAACVRLESGVYRIARRLPQGVEEAAHEAVATANEIAGRHLLKAWTEARSLTPDTSAVMTEGIRAVEAAAGSVLTPKDRKPSLGKIVGALRDQPEWTLVLATRDDGHPDHRLILIGMLETLAFAEQHRHSGKDPSETECLTHVQLASTLVAWFSAGSVVQKPMSV